MNDDSKILNFILHEALVQIREEAYSSKLKKSFTLSKWLHNIPLELIRDDSEEGTKRVLNGIITRAKEDGFYDWLKEASTRHEILEKYLDAKGNTIK